MECKNCGKEIVESKSQLINASVWRHKDGGMFTCFHDDGTPMAAMDLLLYKMAEPKEDEE